MSFQRKIQPIVPFDQTAPNLFYNYLYSISRGIAQYWSFRKLISIFLIIFISIFYSPLCRCFTYCLTYPVKRKTRQNKTQDCDHRSVYPDSFIILAAFDLTRPATPDKNFFFEKKIIILPTTYTTSTTCIGWKTWKESRYHGIWINERCRWNFKSEI